MKLSSFPVVAGRTIAGLFATSLWLMFFQGQRPAEEKDLVRRIRDFDAAWRFSRDNIVGAEQESFDDSKWRLVDLPHDWSIEDIPNPVPGEVIGPFSKTNEGARNGAANAHTIGGTGWYRKKFSLSSTEKGKHITIYFEGAYTSTDVWVNGNHVGSHQHGYTSFYFDITAFCKPEGQPNLIAVKVVNKGANSRWYSGSGLYRHVRLIVADPVHIEPWGLFVTTPAVSAASAAIRVSTNLAGAARSVAGIRLRLVVRNPDNKIVATKESAVQPGSNNVLELSLDAPRLWSVEKPYLYFAKVTVLENGRPIDEAETQFGIRTIQFSAAKGLLLNGQPVELRGGCVHHDNGLLGAASFDRAEERKIILLKKNGYNAVRSSHYPPSPAFLDACDRLGMLVIDEAFDMWQKPKNPDDYHLYFDQYWQQDLSAMVMRDRNHPSIILWSVGNEIQERADSSGLEIVRHFKPIIYQLDSTRSVTAAICPFWDNPGKKWTDADAAFALLDVGGYNYQWPEYENDHMRVPDRVIVGTESFPNQALENWNMVEKHPYVIGDFVWTAMDYLGESGIGHTSCEGEPDDFAKPWPWFNAWCGDIDLAGDKKPQSYYRDIVWRRSQVAIAVHNPLPPGCKEKVFYWGWPDEVQSWTFPGQEGKMMDVQVYSRAPFVRLELNGKIIAEKQIGDSDRLTARFQVPYSPGKLKAIAIGDGGQTSAVELTTASVPAALRLSADRITMVSNRGELAYCRLEVVDAFGRVVPNAETTFDFSISGPATLAAVGNANPADMASFQQLHRKTFRGVALIILRSNGKNGNIELTARAKGLKASTIRLAAQ